MGNIYTGRSLNDLLELCVLDARFYRNSLRNWRPDPGGAGVADIGEYLVDALTFPKQSMVLGMPAMCIQHDTARFAFPNNLDVYLGDEDEFTVEYLGVPQDRLIEDGYMAIMGEDTEAVYFGLRDDNRVEVNFGAQQVSDQQCWWWKDAPLHFVITREAGSSPAPDFAVYINGSEVSFPVTEAGANGFTDAGGWIFNHQDEDSPQDLHPLWGHHLMLRVYNEELAKSECLELYQSAQQMFPHTLFHIPQFAAA
jgi:hypothetical protein